MKFATQISKNTTVRGNRKWYSTPSDNAIHFFYVQKIYKVINSSISHVLWWNADVSVVSWLTWYSLSLISANVSSTSLGRTLIVGCHHKSPLVGNPQLVADWCPSLPLRNLASLWLAINVPLAVSVQYHWLLQPFISNAASIKFKMSSQFKYLTYFLFYCE